MYTVELLLTVTSIVLYLCIMAGDINPSVSYVIMGELLAVKPQTVRTVVHEGNSWSLSSSRVF